MRTPHKKFKGRMTESDFKKLRALIEMTDLTHKQLSEVTGWSRQTVYLTKRFPTFQAYHQWMKTSRAESEARRKVGGPSPVPSAQHTPPHRGSRWVINGGLQRKFG